MTCKSLRLTKWGTLKLSTAFAPEAIEWADTYLLQNPSKSKDTMFNQLFQLCVSYCKSNGLRPNWEALRDLEIPTGAALEEREMPKKGKTDFRRSLIAPSPSPQRGMPSSSQGRQIVYIGTQACYELSEEEANKRRAEFINNPEVVAGIDDLALLLGKESANKYFHRVFENLKYLPMEK